MSWHTFVNSYSIPWPDTAPHQSTDDCCLIPLPHYQTLEVHGPGVSEFLKGLCTIDTDTIPSHHVLPTAFCQRQGRVIASAYLARTDEQRFLLWLPTDMRDALEKHLNTYILRSPITVTPSDHLIFALTGSSPTKEIRSTLTAWSQHPLLPSLQPNLLWGLYQSQQSNTNTPPWPQPLSLASPALWDQWLYQQGQVDIHTATSNLFLPQMLDLERHHGLTLEKGCYLGQEIIIRMAHRGSLKRHLYRSTTSAHNPQVGDELSTEEKKRAGVIVGTTRLQNNWGILAVMEDRLINETLYHSPSHTPITACARYTTPTHT